MKQEQSQSIKRGWWTTSKYGFSLVEAMLAVSIFGMLVTALAGALIYGQRTTISGGDRVRASYLAEEGLEAIRNIRDADYSNLVNGEYGLEVSSGNWILSGTSDVQDKFTRKLIVSTVSDDRKQVTSEVTWQDDSQTVSKVSLSTYLSNWQKAVVVGDCASTCVTLLHLDGTCRADSGECVINSEINESAGDQFCTVNPSNTCCCSVPPDPSDITAPATILDLVVSDASPSSATLSWTAPGDDADVGTATAYDIRYSTSLINESNWSSATYFSTAVVPAIAGSSESIEVTGLMASTDYYFAIKTTDESSNISDLSNVESLTTLEPVDVSSPAAVSDLATSNATSNSVTLAWTAPGDDGGTGTASTYDVRFYTSLIDESNWDLAITIVGEPSPSIAGSSESTIVNGLVSSTQYYFAIKTSDEVPNISNISNVPNLTTSAPPDTTAPGTITDLVLSSATLDSIDLSWTAPGDDLNTGTATSYDIRYSDSAIISDETWGSAIQLTGEPSPQAAGASETVTVVGLNNETMYYFAVSTWDEIPNVSSRSNAPGLSTLAGEDLMAPSAITDLGLLSESINSIELSWTSPGDDGSIGTSTTYDIRYSTSLITEANWASATQFTEETDPQVAGSFEIMSVSGLTSETNYYFAIKTFDEVSNISDISNIPNATTAIDVNSADSYCRSLSYFSGHCSDTAALCGADDGESVSVGWLYCGELYCCCLFESDTTPPAAVTDFRVQGVSGYKITFTFTAPGDNGAYGTATSYDLRYLETGLVTEDNWDSAIQITGEDAPAIAGTLELISFGFPAPSTTYYTAMKTTDEAGNVSGLSKVVNGTTAASDTKVICTEAYRRGLISAELLKADEDYSKKYANKAIVRGYHAWGKPVVRIIQHNLKLAKRVVPFSVEWSKHSAYEMGISKEDSAIGKMLIETAYPLCEKLGNLMAEDNQFDYEFDDAKVEEAMEKYYQDYFNLGFEEEVLIPIIKKDYEAFMALAEEVYLEDRANNFGDKRVVYEDAWFVKIIKFFGKYF